MGHLDGTTLLLAALALTLVLSRAAGRLATRFRQPAVLAEIAVGVALGPTLLGRLLPSVHRGLFTQEVRTVLGGLAQLAVALYAFEIGRHLAADRPGSGRRGGRTPLVLAAASLLAPAVAGLAVAVPLYRHHLAGGGTGLPAFALYLACALGVTAVPVLARILQDRGLAATPVGRLSLVAASIGDAACWCVLGLALWLAGRMGWPQLLAALLGAGAAGLVAHRRPGLRPGREIGVVATTGAICLAAAVSSGLGLHPLFGGLMLGLAWPDHREPGSTAARSGPSAVIGQLAAVLLPCFFLGAGQQVDLGADLTDRNFLLLVALLLVLATGSKFAVCALVGRRDGLGRTAALRLGVLMNTRGLTEIVVLTTGYQAGLIGHRLFEALLVVALLATAAAGPALSLLERAERTEVVPAEPAARTAEPARTAAGRDHG
ncbi:cation:proton antiporter [Streptomyces tateyamensis]|uniref:cation:proton antiporter n=1 Tax=Streptomyces tateyamensis TaxID=565073 RepID=UPI0015E8A054|nr:cation:proton antiporter [Streptomyces tateyamensis]